MLAAHGGLLDLVAHLLRGVLDLGGGLLGAVAGLEAERRENRDGGGLS